MIVEIFEAFPHINDCLSSQNARHTFVFEDKQQNRGVFVNSGQKYHLHIENTSNNAFHFLQNDGCVMNNVRGGQCDYVIFNSISIHFTDIKVASGNYANHRKDAYKQIENTYKFYKRNIDFPLDCNLHALVCFPSQRRIIKPSASTKRKEFKVNYNMDLQEGNYILIQ